MIKEWLIRLLIWDIFERSDKRHKLGKKMLKTDLFRYRLAAHLAKGD